MAVVLYVIHGHPGIRAGGAESYADELYRSIGTGTDFEPVMVSRIGPPQSLRAPHPGTRFAVDEDDHNLHYLHTRFAEFDRLLWSAHAKQLYTEDWRDFLEAISPDIVHFHHAAWLGHDMLRETRHTLADVPIVYTLHEFLGICFNRGQMVRTGSFELCSQASPQRCHECFPDVSPQRFFLRERFIKSAFDHVDLFVAPSRHLRDRYIEWGIDPNRIVCENYGRLPVARVPDPPDAGGRRRIAFFGQLTQYKGVDVLLEAMKILQRRGVEVELEIHGANLDLQPAEFRRRIAGLLAETAASVRWVGPYEPLELAELLSATDWVVVPSLWWEVGPLVIAEALMHRRPVICSDVGAMLERIQDGVNGLHFRVGDADALAAAIERAVGDPGLWNSLRAQITDPDPMDEHVQTVVRLYNQVLSRRGALV